MKKTVTTCLAIITCLAYLMIVNFYQSKDYDQVARMGQTGNSFQVYLQNSLVAPNDQLAFFRYLARHDDLSIILTSKGENNTVEKSVIASSSTFPASSFRLSHLSFGNRLDFYASYETHDVHQRGRIPVFTKNNRVIVQDMERYFKGKQVVDGVYTIIPGKSSKATVIKKLAQFYGVSRSKLLTPTAGMKIEYLTRGLMIMGVLLIFVGLVFVLVNSYYPVAQAGTIGVKKLNGWKNGDILTDLIRPGLVTIVITAILLDLLSLVFFSYLPQGFLASCIVGQTIITVLYLVVNIFTYVMIKHLSIADLLKGKLHLGAGVIWALGLKVLLTVVSVILLINISGALTNAIADYQLQQDWSKEGNLLTLESVSTQFTSNERQATSSLTKWFSKMAQNKGVYYVNSDVYAAKDILPVHSPQLNNEKYELMAVNRNFINAKLTQVQKHLETSPDFLVPVGYQRHAKEMKYLLQSYRYNDLSSKQQKKLKPEQIKINIEYYSEHLQPITYNVRQQKRFVNPIIEVVQEKHLNEGQALALGNTDKASPIKIENNEQSRTQMRQLARSPEVKRLRLKFVTMNKILATSLDATYRGLRSIILILLSAFVINLFAATFLCLYVISSRQKKLAVERLLGYRMFDRYQTEILLFTMLSLGELGALVITQVAWPILLLALVLILTELAVLGVIVRRTEGHDLPFLLKGGLS